MTIHLQCTFTSLSLSTIMFYLTGAKDTDVQGNTTLSITKGSAESKQETDAGISVEGVRQTQARDSKSKEAVEEVRKTYHTVVHICHAEWNVSLQGDAKEPPKAVPPPQQLDEAKRVSTCISVLVYGRQIAI